MRLPILAFLAIFLSILSGPARALESGWQSADYLQARLIAGGFDSGNGNTTITGGLEVRLSEGWHAYWRMPGDSGLPPQFDWSGSSNIKVADLGWPLPQRFDEGGLYTFGYKTHILFPLSLQIEDTSKPATLALKMDMMTCSDICVPQSVSFSLDIPAGYTPDKNYDALLAAARKTLPAGENTPALKIENAVIGPEAVVVTAFSQAGFGKADLFVETGDFYVTAPPQITPDKNDPRRAMIRVAAPEGTENLAKEVSGKTVTLTLTNGRDAVEKTITF